MALPGGRWATLGIRWSADSASSMAPSPVLCRRRAGGRMIRLVPRAGIYLQHHQLVFTWVRMRTMSDPKIVQGFHHVAIRAVDFDQTIRFYTYGLGFSVRVGFSVPGRIDRAAFVDVGDGRYIEIFGPGSTVQAEGRRRRVDEERIEGALLHFCLRVTDVEAANVKALAAGATSRVEPRMATLSGENGTTAEVWIAFVNGPNGEVIEFLKSEQI
jgi:glyoxylase I family protein